MQRSMNTTFDDVSSRHMDRRAGTVAVLMRHSATVLVAAVMVADPADTAAPAGKVLLAVLGVWSAYRLLTRSRALAPTLVDYAATIAVSLAIPLLVSDPAFYQSNCAPVAIVGTAVITYGISLPARWSLPMTLGIAAAYAYGAAQTAGWPHVPEIFNLYYFALQWATSALMRLTVLRVTAAVDTARHNRQRAEIAEQVGAAVRSYDREQARLLHDTVASTLLLVGQGTALPAERLAAQARRDLQILDSDPAPVRDEPVELVGALGDLIAHLRTPARVTGESSLWLEGPVAHPVVAAARETLTNVDRHARADEVTIDIRADRIVISDDGVGFDPAAPAAGHGLAASVIGRMTQFGGRAAVTSSAGNGTTIELSWPTARSEANAVDPERLLERIRVGYGLVLVGFSVINLAAIALPALPMLPNPRLQLALAVLAGLCALSAVPDILGPHAFRRTRVPPKIAAATLMGVAVTQTMLMPPDLIGGQAQWSQSVIGWCLMPLLVRASQSRARALLATYWFVPAAVSLARIPTAATVLNIALGTASILTVQLCVLLFNSLINTASDSAHAETVSRIKLLTREQVTQALQDEYRRRYAGLITGVRPLLRGLADGRPIDAALRRRAQLETQRMRVLFDQSASFDHPLLRALRPAIDAAEERGVDVSLHIEGSLPELAPVDVDLMAAAVGRALDIAGESARIAITGGPNGVVVSIVCHGVTGDLAQYPELAGGDIELTVHGDAAWLTIRSEAGEGDRQGVHSSG